MWRLVLIFLLFISATNDWESRSTTPQKKERKKKKSAIFNGKIMFNLLFPCILLAECSIAQGKVCYTYMFSSCTRSYQQWLYFLIFLQYLKINIQFIEYSVLVSSIISISINSRYVFILSESIQSVQLHVCTFRHRFSLPLHTLVKICRK